MDRRAWTQAADVSDMPSPSADQDRGVPTRTQRRPGPRMCRPGPSADQDPGVPTQDPGVPTRTQGRSGPSADQDPVPTRIQCRPGPGTRSADQDRLEGRMAGMRGTDEVEESWWGWEWRGRERRKRGLEERVLEGRVGRSGGLNGHGIAFYGDGYVCCSTP